MHSYDELLNIAEINSLMLGYNIEMQSTGDVEAQINIGILDPVCKFICTYYRKATDKIKNDARYEYRK